MKKLGFMIVGFMSCFLVNGQKYTTDKSTVKFFSHAALEDITAVNDESSSIFTATNGEVVYAIPIKEFQFDKPSMAEEFNGKYLESDQFPKATFQGKVSGYQPAAVGAQKVTVAGKLTIHGVTQEVQIPGTAENVNGVLTMKSVFIVKLEDYKIEVPKSLSQKIAEQVEVTIEFIYKLL